MRGANGLAPGGWAWERRGVSISCHGKYKRTILEHSGSWLPNHLEPVSAEHALSTQQQLGSQSQAAGDALRLSGRLSQGRGTGQPRALVSHRETHEVNIPESPGCTHGHHARPRAGTWGRRAPLPGRAGPGQAGAPLPLRICVSRGGTCPSTPIHLSFRHSFNPNHESTPHTSSVHETEIQLNSSVSTMIPKGTVCLVDIDLRAPGKGFLSPLQPVVTSLVSGTHSSSSPRAGQAPPRAER